MTTEKHTYGYRMSDIHYEIDMGFLGCNAKLLWNDIISQITNILITKPVKNCFILCKNYHTVHKELLTYFTVICRSLKVGRLHPTLLYSIDRARGVYTEQHNRSVSVLGQASSGGYTGGYG
jgi:hypothetical protein